MLIVSSVIIFSFIGILGAWRPDIDINRVRLLPKESRHNKLTSRAGNQHTRRSIFHNKHNAYDYNRSGISELRPPMHFLPDALPTAESKTIKVHQSREDPRLFYLSDAYTKKTNQKNLNNEVLSAIYPGGDVVRPDSNSHNYLFKTSRRIARLQDREFNYIPEELHRDFCTKCPNDITLVAKAGSDRVKLPYPSRIKSCTGLQVPRGVHYEHMHGPKFGSLLTEGSYSIVGRITFRGKILRHCIMEVRVLTQTCSLPKYLVAHCGDLNKTCYFACRDPKSELLGPSKLSCGDDNRWKGNLPVCRVKTWCDIVSPPAHGRMSCKGVTMKIGLAEGSTCRVRCARGWTWDTRPVTSCHRGSWTNELNCILRNNK